MKSVLRIKEDKVNDYTNVFIRVPVFQNFGEQLGALKLKTYEPWMLEEVNPKDFEYDLQKLEVSLDQGMKWDATVEAKIDQFLADWPKLRPLVLKSVAHYYEGQYPEIKDFYADNPDMEILLPPPGALNVVADLFKIDQISVQKNGAIVVSGECTWDDEHGWGVSLTNGKVSAAGHASDAFE